MSNPLLQPHAPARLLWLEGREPNPEAAVLSPSGARFQLWLAEAQHDAGDYSNRELSRMERVAKGLARKATVLFNPFTGEIRVERQLYYGGSDLLPAGRSG